MWEVLLALLIVLFSILWWMGSRSCPPAETEAAEEDRVRFLLGLLIESRWSGLTFKLLYQHHLLRTQLPGLTNADAPTATDGRATTASAAVPPAPTPVVDPGGVRLFPPNNALLQPQPEIPAAARIPSCPKCGAQMLVRRNRVNRGAFWGCPSWPMCQGTRRPWDTGDSPWQ